MASRTIATIISLRDQFTKPAKKIAKSVSNINRANKRTIKSITKLGRAAKTQFKNIAKYSVMAGAALIGAFGKKSLDAAKVQIEAETKLASVMKNTKGVTDKQIESVKKYAGVLQNQGIIGDEVALSGVQQMATFQLQAKTLKTLMPGMEDLLAQQKGYNASTQDAVSIGNLMGKVMAGQTSALTRVGINFNSAQERVLKYGTEEERAAMLAEVLRQNVGGVNKALSETDDGKIQQAKNSFGDMQEEVGKRLLPTLGKFSQWFLTKIPSIQKTILNTMDSVTKTYKTIKPYLITIKNLIVAILKPLKSLIGLFIDNFSAIAPIIKTLIIAMLAYKTIILAQTIYTTAFAAAEGIKNAVIAMGASKVTLATIAQWAWNAAMTANPIGLIIAAIAGFVIAIIILIKNFDKILKLIKWVWKGLKFMGSIFLEVAKNMLAPLKPLKFLLEGFGKLAGIGKKAWNAVKGFFGGDSKTPKANVNMDMFASGGIAKKPSIFGEAGPEIAIPLNNSKRSKGLLNEANNIIGGNSGNTSNSIVININGDVYGFDNFKEKVAQAIHEIININGSVVIK